MNLCARCGHLLSQHWLDPAFPLVAGEVPREKDGGACAQCVLRVAGKPCQSFLSLDDAERDRQAALAPALEMLAMLERRKP